MRTLGVVAGGVGLAAVAAALGGIPRADAIDLVALSFGAALVAYITGGAVLRRLRSPIVVALIPLISLGVGSLAAAQAMFVSAHDLSALLVVVVGAGTAGVLAASALARELAAARAAADEAAARERVLERSRRQLVAWVSHDLRTPIAGIQAMVEALDDGVVAEPTDVRAYYGRLTGEAKRLARLVDDLFELSRIEADALDLTLEKVSLGVVVSDAVASATILAGTKGVELSRDFDGHPPEVTASARELNRVVAEPPGQRDPPHPSRRLDPGPGGSRRAPRRAVGGRRLRWHPRRRPRSGVRPRLPR